MISAGDWFCHRAGICSSARAVTGAEELDRCGHGGPGPGWPSNQSRRASGIPPVTGGDEGGSSAGSFPRPERLSDPAPRVRYGGRRATCPRQHGRAMLVLSVQQLQQQQQT